MAEKRFNVTLRAQIQEIGREGFPIFYDSGDQFWGDLSLSAVIGLEAAFLDLFKSLGAAGLAAAEAKSGDTKAK